MGLLEMGSPLFDKMTAVLFAQCQEEKPVL